MFLSIQLSAQNLIPNPSFEQKKRCPKKLNRTKLLKKWYSPTKGTPDYFNKCSKKNDTGIPNNFIGNQEPYEGEGYVGIILDILTLDSTITESPIYREYIQCKLLNPLEKNKMYSVQIFVSLGDKSWYTYNNLQVNFSKKELRQDIYFTPQKTPNRINLIMAENFEDKNWYKLESEYLAKGNEEYLTIGNFEYYSTGQRRTLDLSNQGLFPYTYLYLDNLSLNLKNNQRKAASSTPKKKR